MFNLDDEQEVNDFINKYGTVRGLRLAFQLGFRGQGAKKKANSLINYAWNKKTAIGLRKAGKIEKARMYEKICDSIYAEMDKEIRW